MNKTERMITGLIIASFVTAIALYPVMPEQMASHWNASGEVDGYMNKFWGLFLMPLISSAMLLLFHYIPMIDPLRENIKKFRKYFDGFITLIIIFLTYIYALTLAWNSGTVFDMTIQVIPGLALIFYYTGILIGHAKQNYFIGIRTPWTLANETVWNKTHKLGSKLFKIMSVIILIGLLTPDHTFTIMMTTILGLSAYIVIYSYIQYRKIFNNPAKNPGRTQ